MGLSWGVWGLFEWLIQTWALVFDIIVNKKSVSNIHIYNISQWLLICTLRSKKHILVFFRREKAQWLFHLKGRISCSWNYQMDIFCTFHFLFELTLWGLCGTWHCRCQCTGGRSVNNRYYNNINYYIITIPGVGWGSCLQSTSCGPDRSPDTAGNT